MSMLRGLTTMVLTAEDVEAAAAWYADVLDAAPYFRNPETGRAAYVEFRLGPDEDELGIMDRSYAPPGTTGAGTSVTHWHVEDVEATMADLVSRGAQVHGPATVRGDAGFVTGSIIDPFGNVVGLMHSPHWAEQH